MTTARFEGITFKFPIDATLDEIRAVLMQSTTFGTDKELLGKIEQHEGMRKWVYKDSLGNPTIGIGFNLARSGASATLKGVLGFTDKQVRDIRAGKMAITRQQAVSLMREDIKTARIDAADLFESFSTQPRGIQEVLINMVFNLGKKGLKGFKDFRAAIDDRDYNQAAFSMLNNKKADGTVVPTPWATQVKGRATELAGVVQGFGQQGTSGGMEIEDFVPPIEIGEVPQEQPVTELEPVIPDEPAVEEKPRQEALRERVGLRDFAGQTEVTGQMDPGFFQRNNGSFFELTPEGKVVEHGS